MTRDLARLLDGVQRPGDFSTGGRCEMFAPSLDIGGVGVIALPLLPIQAEQIVAVAQRAPFGRGHETLIDTAVRRTWQIGPDRVRIGGQGWRRTLDEIVRRTAEGLGVAGLVEAEFYKLLLYDAGGFFAGHRDTEKSPGMFATLAIVLPSTSIGGDLVVRHQGREARYAMNGSDPSQAAFAAFYADCLHEVLPVVSGCRLTLVYNLVRREASEVPKPPDYGAERRHVARLLDRWAADPEAPRKIVYPLEHAYTPAGLAFAALKGPDAARAATLLGACADADCELHLALLSIEEGGSAAYAGYGGSSGGWDDDGEEEAEFEADEVFYRSETLSDWRAPDDRPTALGPLPTEAGEVSPPDALDDLAPDEQSFSEATGNEGASFERTYRRAALVLWPRRGRLSVVNQGGLAATLPLLSALADRASADGEESATARAEAHDLAGHMIATWLAANQRVRQMASEVGTMLGALRRIGDRERIDAFLARVMAAGGYGIGMADAVVSSLALLPSERAAALCTAIVEHDAPIAFRAAAELLATVTATAAAGHLGLAPEDLRPAGRALVSALPGGTARAGGPIWSRPPPVEPSAVTAALRTLAWIDASATETAARHMLACPASYGFDQVLVPALLALEPPAATSPGAAQLRDAALQHLDDRIALPLAPPRDWARDASLTCTCAHCVDLSRFLGDPSRETWTLRAAEHLRGHVEDTIRRSGSDLACTTIRQGRPFTLSCTKTQASYQGRARQRADDLSKAALLRGGAAPRA